MRAGCKLASWGGINDRGCVTILFFCWGCGLSTQFVTIRQLPPWPCTYTYISLYIQLIYSIVYIYRVFVHAYIQYRVYQGVESWYKKRDDPSCENKCRIRNRYVTFVMWLASRLLSIALKFSTRDVDVPPIDGLHPDPGFRHTYTRGHTRARTHRWYIIIIIIILRVCVCVSVSRVVVCVKMNWLRSACLITLRPRRSFDLNHIKYFFLFS